MGRKPEIRTFLSEAPWDIWVEHRVEQGFLLFCVQAIFRVGFWVRIGSTRLKPDFRVPDPSLS